MEIPEELFRRLRDLSIFDSEEVCNLFNKIVINAHVFSNILRKMNARLLIYKDDVYRIYERLQGKRGAGVARFTIYFIDYVLYHKVLLQDNFYLAVVIEELVKKQLSKLDTVVTHNYFKCACKYFLELVQHYSYNVGEMIRELDASLRYVLRFYDVFTGSRLNLEREYERTVEELESLLDFLSKIADIFYCLAVSSSYTRREKERIANLVFKVYDDEIDRFMYRNKVVDFLGDLRRHLVDYKLEKVAHPARVATRYIDWLLEKKSLIDIICKE